MILRSQITDRLFIKPEALRNNKILCKESNQKILLREVYTQVYAHFITLLDSESYDRAKLILCNDNNLLQTQLRQQAWGQTKFFESSKKIYPLNQGTKINTFPKKILPKVSLKEW